jgi:hypothetical protein
MDWKRIEFIHRTVDSEEILAGKNDGPKGAYFALVEKACNLSEETFENFKNNGAEKFRIYSKAQVAAMSHTKRNSTRIKDDSCKIIISGEEYYVANNLKISIRTLRYIPKSFLFFLRKFLFGNSAHIQQFL